MPCRPQEDYLLKTEPGKLAMIGRTPIGLQNAVWDFFYRVGFRHFFPSQAWEIWPSEANLKVRLDAFESPDFYNRRFAYGAIGTSKENKENFTRWQKRNRMVPSIKMRSSHAYQAIIRRNKEYFEQNPEALALKEDGSRGSKLDPAYPGLLDLVASDAMAQFEKDPELYGVSVEPSDGGSWREDSPLGSATNQALTIANHTAKAIQEKFPGRKVCMLAYNMHSPPPDFDVDPNVIVTVHTYAIRGGYTYEQLLKGWQARKAELGVSDFLSLWVWNKDTPGNSKASDLNYIRTAIPNYHQWGARYWNSGASQAWAPQGLGYYLATRLLWDVDEAKNFDDLVDDFYERAFESAAPEMRAYYEKCILAESRPLLSEDLIGRMYRHLDKALAKTDSPAVQRRILDHIAYVHSLELLLPYNAASGKERQALFDKLASFAWGIRDREMISSGTLIKWSPRWDKALVANENWKSAPKVEDAELREILREGIENNKLMGFDAAAFSRNLVPPAGEDSGERSGQEPMHLVGNNTFYLYADQPKQGLDLEINGARLWPGRGPVRLTVYAEEDAEVDKPVAELEIPADKNPHKVHIPSEFAGVHRVEISDGGSGTLVSWPEGRKAVMPASPAEKMRFVSSYKYDLYFYVPTGTKVIGGFSSRSIGTIRTADGTDVLHFKEIPAPGYFSVEVPDGEDGKWWSIADAKGEKLLMTVPPYLARSPSEGLVPDEVQRKQGGNDVQP